jgi:hypothetical protein
LAILLALILLLTQISGSPSAPADRRTDAGGDDSIEAVVERDPSVAPFGVVALDSVGNGWTDAAGFPIGSDETSTSDGPSDPTPPEPGTDGEPSDDPCDAVLEAGHNLAVGPDPHNLPLNVTESSLTIHNCGAVDVDWTAQTVPDVSLASEAGTLGAGEEHELGFSIAESALDPDFSFKIKVSEPGNSNYVDVHAFKPGLAAPHPPQPPAGDFGFTSGGPSGCALQCITKAWLTPNAMTPNPALEVNTNTPASIAVYVSQNAPVDDGSGNPVFPGTDPIAFSNQLQTEWTTVLAPLEPATDYHIIVKATDAEQGRSYRAGTFRTTTPIEGPDGLAGAEGGGCSVQCITKAWVTPGAPGFDSSLEVDTHTPATIEVFVSADAPSLDGDENPSFPGVAAIATSDGPTTDWDTTLPGLDMGATYHIIVRATDEDGNRSYRAGSFATSDAPKVVVTFHYLKVTHDGDSSWKNRGELRFGMEVDDVFVARTGEDKMHSGTTVHFDDGDGVPGISYLAEAGEFLPVARMDASERDWDGLSEFCSLGDGVPNEAGSDGSCDLKWNVADSGSIPTSSLGSLTDCSELGVDSETGNHCVKIETTSHGDDYPSFWAIVSFRTVGG